MRARGVLIAFVAATTAKAAVLTPLPRAVPAQRPDFDEGHCHCIAIPGGGRLCNGIDDRRTRMVLEVPGRPPRSWASVDWMGNTQFQAMRGDLDGDGHDELVVATLGAVSNGMAVASWVVNILADRDRTPLVFTARDWGPRFTRTVDGRTAIVATEWNGDTEPSRGWGSYYTGRPYRYREGQLEPDTTEPVRVRRLLNSFANERGLFSSSGYPPYGRPIVWLRDPRARAHSGDPLLRSPAISTQPGTLREIVRPPRRGKDAHEDAWTSWMLRVALDSGATRDYAYAVRVWQPPGSLSPSYALGDAASGRLYPLDYVPADDGAALAGRRVNVTGYCFESEGGPCDPYTILWIEAGRTAAP